MTEIKISGDNNNENDNKNCTVQGDSSLPTETNTLQSFYSSLEFVWDYAGELLPESSDGRFGKKENDSIRFSAINESIRFNSIRFKNSEPPPLKES